MLEDDALGALLMRPEQLLQIDLTEDDFARPGSRAIYRALLRLHADNEAINIVSLREAMSAAGTLTLAGGPEALAKLAYKMPPRDLPLHKLREKAKLRGIEKALSSAMAACADGSLDEAIGALADAHAAALSGTAKNRTENVLELCTGLLEEMRSPPDPNDNTHLGFEILSELAGPMPRQTSIGVLADTNVGKSTFSMEMLVRMAARNVVCGYLSVEDQKRRVRARVAGMLTGVSSRSILQHRMNSDEGKRFYENFQEIVRLEKHLHFAVLQGGTDADVRAAMSELAHRGCRAVVIDYLQKIEPYRERKQDNKATRVAEMCSRITSHAQRLNMLVVIVSQCTRDKQRMNECPTKHDMKESGELENMLDVVIGLWRECEDDRSPTWARLIKTKDGGLGGSWCMQRDKETGRMEEIKGSDKQDPPDSKGDWQHRKKKQGSSNGQAGGYGR